MIIQVTAKVGEQVTGEKSVQRKKVDRYIGMLMAAVM